MENGEKIKQVVHFFNSKGMTPEEMNLEGEWVVEVPKGGIKPYGAPIEIMVFKNKNVDNGKEFKD